MPRTTVRTLAGLAVVAVVAAGCAGSTTAVDDLPADAVFLTAVDRTTDTSGVRVGFSMEMDARPGAEGGIGEYVVSGSGEGVFGSDAMQMTWTFSVEGQASTLEVRLVDGVVYQHVPQGGPFGGPDSDVEWLTVDLSSPEAEQFSTMQDYEQFDFMATLEALRDAVEVTEAGRDTVEGVPTTRYTGTATQRALLEAQGAQQSDVTEDESFLDEEVPVTVWIDDDGLIRRLDLQQVGGGVTTTTSMVVLGHDVEVVVEAPPDDQTMTMAEYQEQVTSSFGGPSDEDFQIGELEEVETFEMEAEASGEATAQPVPAP